MDRAQERRSEAAAVLALGVDHVAHDPRALADHLQFCACFRTYSFRNTLLLAEQARQRGTAARFFRGYRAWQKEGRQVRKGERGYMLYAPIVRRLFVEDARAAGVEEGERAVVAFRVATVFDLDQTDVIEGQEDRATVYASPIAPLTGTGFALLRDDLHRVAAGLGFLIRRYPPHERRATGYCQAKPGAPKVIGVKQAKPDQEAAVLAHELAHAFAHTDAAAQGLTKAEQEIQAEGAAFLACYALGLNTARASLPYLKTWATGETPEERRESITRHLAAIDRIGWTVVEAVEAVRDARAEEVATPPTERLAA
ncbi:MAG: ArdC family protein [Bacteroidota bacterium]